MQNNLENGKQIIKKYVDNNKLPGAVFAYVTKDDLQVDYYGYRSLTDNKPALTDADTIYDLASLSKVTCTQILIYKLMEEGLISLKMPVKSILPEYKYDDITIRHLMTHTSGLPADDKNYKNCKDGQQLWQFICDLDKTYQTGSKVEYSCFGFIILGKIIEHFKGNIEDYAKEVIFQPMGLTNMMYNPASKGRKGDCAPTEVTEARGVIQGDVHDGKAFILGGLAGNAGLFADIYSVSAIVQMILNNGNYKGKQILSSSSIKLMTRPFTDNLNEIRTIGGWYYGDRNTSNGDYFSANSLYHTGFTGTSIYIDLDRQCGVVLLTNAINPSRVTKIVEIRNLFYNQVLLAADRKGR